MCRPYNGHHPAHSEVTDPRKFVNTLELMPEYFLIAMSPGIAVSVTVFVGTRESRRGMQRWALEGIGDRREERVCRWHA